MRTFGWLGVLVGISIACQVPLEEGIPPGGDGGKVTAVPPLSPSQLTPAYLPGPLALQLHLHGSLSEGNATMAFHTQQAAMHLTDLLWWTDHDFMHTLFRAVSTADFEGGTTVEDHPGIYNNSVTQMDWVPTSQEIPGLETAVTPEAAGEGGYGWEWKSEGGTCETGWCLASQEWAQVTPGLPNHRRSLLGEVRLGVKIRPVEWEEEGVTGMVAVRLSSALDGQSQFLIYAFGDADGFPIGDAYRCVVPVEVTTGAWNPLSLPLSEDAERCFPEGDDQGSFQYQFMVKAVSGARFRIQWDALILSQAITGMDLLARQEQVLSERYSEEVHHLVGYEATLVDPQHMNVFGSGIPMPDYEVFGVPAQGTDIAEFVHEYGGIVSYNHPFGAQFSVTVPEEERAGRVADAAAVLIDSRVEGADLLEVGYYAREVSLTEHLALWDAISGAGIPVTGIGTTDMHEAMAIEMVKNPMVTWVWASSIEEDALLADLRRGAAWFGDPHAFERRPRVALTDLTTGATQGQVILGGLGTQEVRLEANPLLAGDTVEVVVDGGLAESKEVTEDGAWSGASVVEIEAGFHFIRFQVVRDGVGILFSNPLYFSDGDGSGIGPERWVLGS